MSYLPGRNYAFHQRHSRIVIAQNLLAGCSTKAGANSEPANAHQQLDTSHQLKNSKFVDKKPSLVYSLPQAHLTAIPTKN